MLKLHRYCQALMRARQGESVLLDDSGIACPAAAGAFGFRPLPTGLQTGKGLVAGHVQLQDCPVLNEPQYAEQQAHLADLLAVDLPAIGRREA